MCLAQEPQHSNAGEARTHGPSVSGQALYHWATALPQTQIPIDSVFDKKCKNDTNTLYYTHDYTRRVYLSKINFHYIIKDYSFQKIQFAF